MHWKNAPVIRRIVLAASGISASLAAMDPQPLPPFDPALLLASGQQTASHGSAFGIASPGQGSDPLGAMTPPTHSAAGTPLASPMFSPDSSPDHSPRGPRNLLGDAAMPGVSVPGAIPSLPQMAPPLAGGSMAPGRSVPPPRSLSKSAKRSPRPEPLPTPSASASSSSASVRQAEPDILELAGVVRPADGDPAKIQIIGNGFALFEGKRVRVLFRNNPVPYTLVNRNLLDVDLPDPVTDLGDALAVQVYQPDSGSIVEIDIASAFIAVDPGSIQVYDDPGMLLHADPPTGPWPGWTEMVRKAFPHG